MFCEAGAPSRNGSFFSKLGPSRIGSQSCEADARISHFFETWELQVRAKLFFLSFESLVSHSCYYSLWQVRFYETLNPGKYSSIPITIFIIHCVLKTSVKNFFGSKVKIEITLFALTNWLSKCETVSSYW